MPGPEDNAIGAPEGQGRSGKLHGEGAERKPQGNPAGESDPEQGRIAPEPHGDAERRPPCPKTQGEGVTPCKGDGQSNGGGLEREPAFQGVASRQQGPGNLDKLGIEYDVCPGVSSFCGAAAALKAEYTLPDVSQTVIITRMEGRTPVPPKEKIHLLASHNATMVIFLSTGLLKELSAELVKGGYSENTPAAIVYKATWKDEKVMRCTVGTLNKTAEKNGIKKTALITVGDFLGDDYSLSKLYDKTFTTEFRKGVTE